MHEQSSIHFGEATLSISLMTEGRALARILHGRGPPVTWHEACMVAGVGTIYAGRTLAWILQGWLAVRRDIHKGIYNGGHIGVCSACNTTTPPGG